MRFRVQWSLTTAGLLILAMAFPASAQAKVASAPIRNQTTNSSSDSSFAAERRLARGTLPGASMPVARPSAPSVPCPTGWVGYPSQNGAWHNELGGVAGVAGNDMWAVGDTIGTGATAFGPGGKNLAEHWDGNFWSTVSVPSPGSDDNILNDVAAIASNDVWAVGFSSTTGSHSGTTFHWNGTTWTQYLIPATPPVNGQTELNDVVAFGTDVWAVGQQEAFNSTNTVVLHPLVLHWSGTAWIQVAVPTPGEGDSALYGVGGSSSTDIYAVGYSRATTTSVRQELILHWNGTAPWTATALTATSVSRTLWSVAALSTTDAMAVGVIRGASYATLAERSTDRGASWNGVGTTSTNAVNVLGDVVASPPSGYYAVGFSRATWINSASYSVAQPLFGSWSGTAWTFSAGQAVGSSDSAFNSMVVPTPGALWAVGEYILSNGLSQTLAESYNPVAPPTSVAAAAADQSASLTWTAPTCIAGTTITGYQVFAYDGCTTQSFMQAPASPFTFTGLTNGTAYTFRVAAVTAFGMGQLSAPSNTVTSTGATSPSWVTACSRQQYQLVNNDGVHWGDVDATNLNVSFTPSVDSFAILTGNSDLWTDTAGYNQDLGIAVKSVTGTTFPSTPGQPEGWKESGGFAGTFSPNAAYVQTVISVKANLAYTARLQWKTNRADPGTIFAGAGPLLVYPGDCWCSASPQTLGYSPTRISVQLIPATSALNASSTLQYNLTGNDGSRWMDMDAANLSVAFNTPATGSYVAYLMGNSDLWTQSAGYNQDIGITLSGGGVYPSTNGQPEAWKESGGFAGTFSPNAAFVQAALPVAAGTPYTAKLQWKANKPDPGTIWAGAGPIGGKYSPTSLTVILVQAANSKVAASTTQFSQVNSDGTYWQPVDPSLTVTLNPSSATSYQVAANADLWTANAGYNQDIGIMVSGGGYGGGTLVAWKESGGFAGTYSPNAAFVTANLHLQPGLTYTVWVVWKANIIATSANQIFIGAGPIGTKFSPTWLTAMQLSSP